MEFQIPHKRFHETPQAASHFLGEKALPLCTIGQPSNPVLKCTKSSILSPSPQSFHLIMIKVEHGMPKDSSEFVTKTFATDCKIGIPITKSEVKFSSSLQETPNVSVNI